MPIFGYNTIPVGTRVNLKLEHLGTGFTDTVGLGHTPFYNGAPRFYQYKVTLGPDNGFEMGMYKATFFQTDVQTIPETLFTTLMYLSAADGTFSDPNDTITTHTRTNDTYTIYEPSGS